MKTTIRCLGLVFSLTLLGAAVTMAQDEASSMASDNPVLYMNSTTEPRRTTGTSRSSHCSFAGFTSNRNGIAYR
jgi:hypothetical protein